MSQKSYLDNKKSRKNFPYVGRGGRGSTNIWKIPYVLSFLFLKASLRKALKKLWIFPHFLYPQPPKVRKIKVPLKMILKCQNTFWVQKILQFPPENDLPTHKNLKFWSLHNGARWTEGPGCVF